MALALVLAGAAQGHPVVEQHIVSHLGGLADDDAHAVVDDETAADLRPGVDLDSRALPVPLGLQPGQEIQMVTIEPMGDPVADDGVNAGVQQEYLQL